MPRPSTDDQHPRHKGDRGRGPGRRCTSIRWPIWSSTSARLARPCQRMKTEANRQTGRTSILARNDILIHRRGFRDDAKTNWPQGRNIRHDGAPIALFRSNPLTRCWPWRGLPGLTIATKNENAATNLSRARARPLDKAIKRIWQVIE